MKRFKILIPSPKAHASPSEGKGVPEIVPPSRKTKVPPEDDPKSIVALFMMGIATKFSYYKFVKIKNTSQ